MHITGNPLRDFNDRKKSFSIAQQIQPTTVVPPYSWFHFPQIQLLMISWNGDIVHQKIKANNRHLLEI